MPQADGAAHDDSIGYDAEAAVMQIAVDGKVLAQAEQTGLTPVAHYLGLAIRSGVGDTLDADLTHFSMNTTADWLASA